jgi:hypothetical protein
VSRKKIRKDGYLQAVPIRDETIQIKVALKTVLC